MYVVNARGTGYTLAFISNLRWFNFLYMEVTDTKNRASNCNSNLHFHFAVCLNN